MFKGGFDNPWFLKFILYWWMAYIAAPLQNTGIVNWNAWCIQLKKGVFWLKVSHKLSVAVCFSGLIPRTGDVFVLFVEKVELAFLHNMVSTF